MEKISFVSLYHGVGWNCPIDIINLSNGVTIGNFESSPINDLYAELCKNHYVDEGDPFEYQVYATFNKINKNEIFFDFGSSYSVIDKFSNILAIVLNSPISMCRILWSEDDFLTIKGTERIYYSTEQVGELFDGGAWHRLSIKDVNNIKKMWANISNIYRKYKCEGRVVNILSYYYFAWRSHSVEQVIINLAIVLELLFAPHFQSEVSHQVSFNASKYLGKDSEDRNNIYKILRKFYGVRSAIMHGGMPEYDKINKIAIEIHSLVTNIIVSIISNVETIKIFSDDTKRRELFNRFMFE